MDNAQLHTQIHNFSAAGNAFPEHNVKLGLLERRGHLVLDHLHFYVIAQGIVPVLDLRGATDVQPHGSVELEGVAAGGGFRIAEHDANLLTQLVDEDAAGVGFGDVGREFAQGLAHQAGLQTHFVVSHLPFYLCARGEGGHGVNHHYIHGTAADEVIGNFQGLLPVVRLGNEEGIQVYAQRLGIGAVERVLCVDDGRNAAGLLGLRNGMDGQGGFTGAFRSVNLDDAAFGVSADAQCMIQRNGAAGNHLGSVPFGLVSQFHDGAFTVIFLNLVDCCLERF